MNDTKSKVMEDGKWKTMCGKASNTVRFYLSDEVKAPFMVETSPNELLKKLEGMYLFKSLTSRTALKKQLYPLRMEECMNLMAHIGAFNTLILDVFNAGGKIEKEDQACLFMVSLPKSYDLIMMSLLGLKSELTMTEVTAVLLNSESLRQREDDGSESSSVLMAASDWRRRKKFGHRKCHKCGKLSHF